MARSGRSGRVVRRTETTTYSHGRARWIALLALLVVPIVLAFLAAYPPLGIGDKIENDLAQKGRRALDQAGFTALGLRVQGRDATLTDVRDLSGDDIDRAKGVLTADGEIRKVSVESLSVFDDPSAAPTATSAWPTNPALPPSQTNSTAPAAPPPAPDPAGAKVALQNEINGVLSANPIQFQPNSAELAASSIESLRTIADLINAKPGLNIEIGGHIAEVGQSTVETISGDRAETVRDQLVSLGVEAARLTAVGYGATRPLDPGNPASPTNRRVEIVVL